MTKYTVDVPDVLWESWKETVRRSRSLNDGLVRLLAETTLDERGGELTASEREAIEAIRDEV